MNNEEIFRLTIKEFLRNGGVVLASNYSSNIVGVKGDIDEINQYFAKALIAMSLTVIKKDPKDFEVIAASTISFLMAVAKIAEQKYDAPQLVKNVMYLIMEAASDKDVAYLTELSVKRVMEEIEKGRGREEELK